MERKLAISIAASIAQLQWWRKQFTLDSLTTPIKFPMKGRGWVKEGISIGKSDGYLAKYWSGTCRSARPVLPPVSYHTYLIGELVVSITLTLKSSEKLSSSA